MPEPSSRADLHRQVIAEFRANGGKVGGYFAEIPLLLLTTTGARTGRQRTTALAYLVDGARYVVVAANAGRPRTPDWYYNLLANPGVTVEVGTETFEATASVATGGEGQTLSDRFAAQSRSFAGHRARATREIPVVVLAVRHG